MSIEEIYEIIKASKVTLTDFSKHIASYLDLEWDTKYKNRIANILSPKGSTNPTQEELGAMTYWCEVHENPFLYSELNFKLRDSQKSLNFIVDAMFGKRSYNVRDAKRVRSLMSVIKKCLH